MAGACGVDTGTYFAEGPALSAYIDVYFQGSSLGSVSITDANALRPAGSSWTVPGSVTALGLPGAGRVAAGVGNLRRLLAPRLESK